MRVDQVGSLAPSPKLRSAFSDAPFQDEAVREIIRTQEAIGFPIVTDGELRRSNFQESFGAAVTGFHVAHEDKAMQGVARTAS
jgi:5-methyltetrahydropteroyltriglutamate--homocysteine methyltransferase